MWMIVPTLWQSMKSMPSCSMQLVVAGSNRNAVDLCKNAVCR